jgi:hypothetical protein
MQKAISICAAGVFALSFFQSCNREPDVILNEIIVEQEAFEEVIHMNNCGGAADSEQTVTRTFSTNLDIGAEISAGYHGLIEGRLSAMYGQQREVAKSVRLIAPPGTDMQFLLRWSENVHAGSVSVDGGDGEYSVRVPIGVEQVSSENLTCSTSEQAQTEPDLYLSPSPTSASAETHPEVATPTSMKTVNISKPTQQEFGGLANIWDLFNYENPTTPKTLIYTVPIAAEQIYRWGAIWCGINAENLVNISAPLTMNLLVNDELLSEDQILEFDEIRNGWHCHRWVTKLSNWQPETLTKLELSYVLNENIFDGVGYTGQGEYHLIINVQAK